MKIILFSFQELYTVATPYRLTHKVLSAIRFNHCRLAATACQT